MATTVNHIEMINIKDTGDLEVLYPKNTSKDVSVNPTSGTAANTALQSDSKILSTLIDKFGTLSFINQVKANNLESGLMTTSTVITQPNMYIADAVAVKNLNTALNLLESKTVDVSVVGDTLVIKSNGGGVSEGTDTSDATATAEDILLGETAYARGEKLTGTIPLKEEATYIPTTEDQTIEAGKYLKGNQIIKGDSNLLAENIKKGISIFGVDGILNQASDYGWIFGVGVDSPGTGALKNVIACNVPDVVVTGIGTITGTIENPGFSTNNNLGRNVNISCNKSFTAIYYGTGGIYGGFSGGTQLSNGQSFTYTAGTTLQIAGINAGGVIIITSEPY